MKVSTKDFFNKCEQTCNFFTLTKEIVNEKLFFFSFAVEVRISFVHDGIDLKLCSLKKL